MIDPNEFAALDQGATQYLSSLRPAQAAQQPKKKKKNFLLDQISTAGGILGGIGGSFIAPIAGTVGGAAAGSALGETLENALMGDSLGKNVVKEAALGGVFAAPPIRAAKAAIGAVRGSKAAPGVATNAIEGEVVSQGGKKSIDGALKTSATGRLDDLANRALTSQYGTISKPVARATKPEETFGKLANYGVTKPKDVESIAQGITGADGLITRAVSSAVGNAGRVKTDGLRQTLDDALENAGVVDASAKEVRALFNAQMKKLNGGPAGSLKPDANPTDVIEVMRNIEARIAEKTGQGSNYRLATDATRNQAKALRLVRDELEDRLYEGAGANKNLAKVLTPELRENLVALKPNDPLWENFVDKNVMNAKNVGQLRGSVAPFVRARQIIEEADVNSMTFGGRGGNFVNSLQGGLGSAAAGVITNIVKNPAARAAASTLRTVSGSAPTLPGNLGRPSPGGIAARLGTVGAVGGGLNQLGQLAPPVSAAGLDDALSQPPTAPLNDPSRANGMLPQPDAAGDNPFAPDRLQESVKKIIANGGTLKDAAEFVNLAETLTKLQGPADSKLNSTTATLLSASANATNTLDQLEGLFGSAGGGSGKVSGTVKNVLSRGGFDGDTQTYNDLAASSVSQLARALNGGGQVSDADAAVVVQALPKITDSPEVARNKFAALKARLLAARQNTLSYNSADAPTSDLASALSL